MKPRHALVAVTVVASLSLFACAKTVIDEVPTTDADSTDPVGNASSSGSTAGTSSKDGGASSSSKDSGTTKKPPQDPPENDPAPAGGQCISETSFDTCVDCCGTAHPAGSDTFYGSYINCLCGGSVCGLDCSVSLCDPTNPTSPDADCDACIQASGSSCQADVAAACSADPDCIAFDTCVGDSQCDSKP